MFTREFYPVYCRRFSGGFAKGSAMWTFCPHTLRFFLLLFNYYKIDYDRGLENLAFKFRLGREGTTFYAPY